MAMIPLLPKRKVRLILGVILVVKNMQPMNDFGPRPLLVADVYSKGNAVICESKNQRTGLDVYNSNVCHLKYTKCLFIQDQALDTPSTSRTETSSVELPADLTINGISMM